MMRWALRSLQASRMSATLSLAQRQSSQHCFPLISSARASKAASLTNVLADFRDFLEGGVSLEVEGPASALSFSDWVSTAIRRACSASSSPSSSEMSSKSSRCSLFAVLEIFPPVGDLPPAAFPPAVLPAAALPPAALPAPGATLAGTVLVLPGPATLRALEFVGSVLETTPRGRFRGDLLRSVCKNIAETLLN